MSHVLWSIKESTPGNLLLSEEECESAISREDLTDASTSFQEKLRKIGIDST